MALLVLVLFSCCAWFLWQPSPESHFGGLWCCFWNGDEEKEEDPEVVVEEEPVEPAEEKRWSPLRTISTVALIFVTVVVIGSLCHRYVPGLDIFRKTLQNVVGVVNQPLPVNQENNNGNGNVQVGHNPAQTPVDQENNNGNGRQNEAERAEDILGDVKTANGNNAEDNEDEEYDQEDDDDDDDNGTEDSSADDPEGDSANSATNSSDDSFTDCASTVNSVDAAFEKWATFRRHVSRILLFEPSSPVHTLGSQIVESEDHMILVVDSEHFALFDPDTPVEEVDLRRVEGDPMQVVDKAISGLKHMFAFDPANPNRVLTGRDYLLERIESVRCEFEEAQASPLLTAITECTFDGHLPVKLKTRRQNMSLAERTSYENLIKFHRGLPEYGDFADGDVICYEYGADEYTDPQLEDMYSAIYRYVLWDAYSTLEIEHEEDII